MKGKDIKDVLTKRGISQSEGAKMLGIAPNNLNNMLAKEDVRTGLLESIAAATKVPICVFYGETYNNVSGCNNATGNHSNNTVNASDDRLLNLLMSKDEQLTMAMKQTSKAQEHMDVVLQSLKGKHIV